MLTTDFSIGALSQAFRAQDKAHYPFSAVVADRDNYLKLLSAKIENGTFDFDRLVEKTIGRFRAYRTKHLGDDLVLRRLASVIAHHYRIKQSDRTALVKQTRVLLSEPIPKRILRLDIASFYESVQTTALATQLARDRRISHQSLSLIQKFFHCLKKQNITGLPRGLSISSALSEVVVQEFDSKAKNYPGVYFYGRYVDDIIIFGIDDPVEAQAAYATMLPPGMAFNASKCASFVVDCRCRRACIHAPAVCTCLSKCKCKMDPAQMHSLDFLGYKISFPDVHNTNNDESIKIFVGMSRKKINRIKTRLVRAALDHLANPSFPLLEQRVRFLTENYRVSSFKNKGRLKSGVYYNYALTNDNQWLQELDVFHRNLLFAKKTSLGTALSSSLMPAQRAALRRLSFKSGFTARRSSKVSANQMALIRKCWRRV